ncbi:MAG: ACP S-malonyltransferase [Alphaproteobacteria bacterium]
MERAFVFPGQGSQAVGMGKALAEAHPAAREIFEEVDEALSQRLSRLMFEGPVEELTLTENAQPALMAVSVAIVRVLQREGGLNLQRAGRFVAGHSLGEYSALAAAGALPVAEAARLRKRRGLAMQGAVPVGTGAMAAILGLDLDTVRALAEEAAEGEVCAVANDNAPGQVVLSGAKAAVDRAVALAQGRKGKAIPLTVSAPFHCALLKPAADVMAEALAGVSLTQPHLPLVSNVTATAVDDPDTIRDLLVEQVTAMVRWRESVLYMKAQGVEQLVELGAGKVLTAMVRRIDPEMTGASVQTPADIEAFAGQL